MPTPASTLLAATLVTTALVVAGFLAYVVLRYAPIVGRIFEEKPLFLPLRLPREPGGDDVRFTTEDGLALAGTYYRASAPSRVGVLVFCHEFLGDRWSFRPYLGPLRARGFDVFTFDFRNHGDSPTDPLYKPLQWVTDHEVNDLNAALTYLRTRADRDDAGFGLFGVSRGGSAALVVAAQDPNVWGVITDGAFPTRGTMLAYIRRWAEIYVTHNRFWGMMPFAVFQFLAWAGRLRSEKRLHCRFPDVERAVARIGPRPWLLIHGEKDAYIMPAIARALFELANEPKAMWVVPKAKHNRGRQVAPEAYADHVARFLRDYAPRRELPAPRDPGPAEAPSANVEPAAEAPLDNNAPGAWLAGELTARLPH